MNPDVPTPDVPDGEAAPQTQGGGLDPAELSPARREALLRRILQRTGKAPPPAPAVPPENE